MANISVRNWNNETVRTLELSDTVFDYPVKEHLVYEAVLAYRAGGRAGTHKTKNRVEVSGGGRRLWKQKGTGRARMGDNRSPLWRHGGTVHGPQPRDYSWKLPKKMRWNAIKSVLSQKLRDGKLVCVDAFETGDHKTRALEAAVGKGLGISGKVLLVPHAELRGLDLASRNNPRLKVTRALGLNVVDLLDYEVVVMSEDALKQLGEVLG
jgi:large subunit ribosomal protein L4